MSKFKIGDLIQHRLDNRIGIIIGDVNISVMWCDKNELIAYPEKESCKTL